MNIPKLKRDDYDREKKSSELLQFIVNELKDFQFNVDNIYYLLQLTWYDARETSKIRALNGLFKKNYQRIQDFIKDETIPNNIKIVIEESTGYVNFYHVYRNSSKKWLKKNIDSVLKIVNLVLDEKLDDKKRIRIAETIESLPGIKKPNSDIGSMHPINLLSPLLTCLDIENRFPIINGANAVVKLYKKLKITNMEISEKVRAIFRFMEKGDISDAFELDVMSNELSKRALPDYKKEIQNIEKVSDIGRVLAWKNDDDVEYFRKNITIKTVRLHNKMTNELNDLCENNGYKIIEGIGTKYDALIEKYDGKNDLLVEVKSSSNQSDIRLAIGQLFDYKDLLSKGNIKLAIFVPEKPIKRYIELLSKLNIDVYWKENNNIKGTGRLELSKHSV